MKLARIAACLLLLPAALIADEGVATFKHTRFGEMAGPAGESKVYFRNDAYRAEMQMELGGAARDKSDSQPRTMHMTMAQNSSDPDKLYMINDERRTYSVTNLAEVADSTPAKDRGWKVERTGSDRVAGIPCEKAVATASDGATTEVCMAREINASSLWLRGMNRNQRRAGNWYKAMQDAGLKGFPIRMRVTSAERNGGFEMELTSLDKKPVPASLFQLPPPGYTQSSGAMIGMTPEQEKRMQEMLSKMTPEQRKAFEDAMKERQQPK